MCMRVSDLYQVLITEIFITEKYGKYERDQAKRM